jgi:hypothetical protein
VQKFNQSQYGSVFAVYQAFVLIEKHIDLSYDLQKFNDYLFEYFAAITKTTDVYTLQSIDIVIQYIFVDKHSLFYKPCFKLEKIVDNCIEC